MHKKNTFKSSDFSLRLISQMSVNSITRTQIPKNNPCQYPLSYSQNVLPHAVKKHKKYNTNVCTLKNHWKKESANQFNDMLIQIFDWFFISVLNYQFKLKNHQSRLMNSCYNLWMTKWPTQASLLFTNIGTSSSKQIQS